MNKKFIQLLPVTLAAVGVTGAFLTQSAFAEEHQTWGPQDRETFTWNAPATYTTFNSMTDNPSLGYETNFVRIREAGTENVYADDVTLEVGKEYEVFMYYHNNGAANYQAAVMAYNTRIKANFPTKLEKNQAGEVKGTIYWTNSAATETKNVWDTAYMHANTTVYLSYVPNSAVLHNGSTGQYKTDGALLDSESLFGDGAKVAYDSRYWGIIPGCNEYAGYVTYRIKVDQPGWYTSKTVSAEDADDYNETMTAAPGDVLDFKISYKNTGTTWQTAVTVHDQMPEGLEYVQGSTFAVTPAVPSGVKVADKLFEDSGLNIGDFNAGQEATITYKGRLTTDETIFACGETTIYNNAWLVTENGTQYDKVKIVVKRTCNSCEEGYTLKDGVCVADDKFPDDKPPIDWPEQTPSEYVPEELPKTGPTEIAMAAMILVLLVIGGTYWFVSYSKLQKMTKNASGGDIVKDGIINK